MTDNEERIGIATFKDVGKPDFELCGTNLMTRIEAIEIMAKALYEEDNLLALDNIKFEELGASKQMAYKNYAVAILNALLGEQGNETD